MALESLQCPNCGASLAVYGEETITVCSYCNSTIRLAPGPAASGGGRVATLERAEAAASDEPGPLTQAERAAAIARAQLTDEEVRVGAEQATAEILSLLREGKKIEAIKVYRLHTDLGLKESKDAVEALERNPGDASVLESLRLGKRRPAAAVLNPSALAEVRQLLSAGKKIEAIKLYRERTDLGLKEAKHAVEALESGMQDASAPVDLPQRSGVSAGDMAEIREHLLGGNKIEAIKVYRQRTGLGLKEAKDEVEALERTQGWTPRRGRSAPAVATSTGIPWGWGLVLVALLVLGWGAWQYVAADAETRWPTAPGVITDSWTCTVTVNGSQTYSGPCVGYTYTVGGQAYEWHSEDDDGLDFQKSWWGFSGIPDRYAEGREVLVRYDPGNPARSRLEVGPTPFTWAPIALGLVLLAVPVRSRLRQSTR